MLLILAKIAVTILAVVIIAEISKRVNPHLGGLLLGLPLGVGLSVYFIAYEQGVDFMVAGIPWGLAGLAPGILFCMAYLFAGRIFTIKNRLAAILVCSLAGFLVFFAAGFGLSRLELGLLPALILFLAVYLLNIPLVKRLRERTPEPVAGGKTNALTAFLIRGVISGVIIAAVTGAAATVGTSLAGVLSAFPSTTYTLLVVLQFEEGDALYPFSIYGFSYGVSTLAVFYVLCWFLLPALGLNAGFAVTYVVCLGYLYAVKAVSDRLQGTRMEKSVR